MIDGNARSLKYFTVKFFSVAIFARRSRRVSLGDVTANGPVLTEPRTPRD